MVLTACDCFWLNTEEAAQSVKKNSTKSPILSHMGKFSCLHLHMTRLRCRMISDLGKITAKPLYTVKLGAAHAHWSFFTALGVCLEIRQLINCVCTNLTFLSTLWQSVNKIEEAGRTDYKILAKSCVGHHSAQNSNPSSVSYQLCDLRQSLI